jgi:hypothetical protein
MEIGGKNLFIVIIPHPLYCLHVLHIMCCVQRSNPAELSAVVHSYTTVAMSEPLLIAQLNYSNAEICPLHARNVYRMATFNSIDNEV